MYSKAIFFHDEAVAQKILKEKKNPLSCKRWGRKVSNFDQDAWSAASLEAMERSCYLKFAQNPNLAETLLSTENRELVEAAENDRIWGIGFNEEDAATTPRSQWGTNWLGIALMKVRCQLREEKENTGA